MMDEETKQAELDVYKSQLAQVNQAIQAAGSTEDLRKLKEDLEELIKLTEDSLLEIKKEALLRSLDAFNQPSNKNSTENCTDDIDDEYAAFQAAVGVETEKPKELKTDAAECGPSASTDSTFNESLKEQFSELIGMKCQAPFTHDWGSFTYKNAMITDIVISDDADCLPKAKVMFMNPTHLSMLPCKYYLNGHCNYSDEDCKFSHGHDVDIDDVKEFKEADYSKLKLGGKCLAKYEEDGLWYMATIVDVTEQLQHYIVKYDSYDETNNVTVEDILPQDSHEDSSDSSDNEEVQQNISSSDEEEALPVFLWKPPKTTDRLGSWEEHTKGIGSRLMVKMGYIVGQGLGKNGEGRAEPVPIQLIPQGKSLDKIMELKEIAGDMDLFDAMKRLKKRKKLKHGSDEKDSKNKEKSKSDVFDFLNKKLHGKKGEISSLISHSNSSSKTKKQNKKISEKELHEKSDRHINIQLLKTEEEIRGVEKEIIKLKQSINRNEQNKSGSVTLKEKLKSLQSYLHTLKNSEKTMGDHKKKRKDKKSMIF